MTSPYELALAAVERGDLRAVDALVAEHVMGWTNLIKLDYATVGEDPRGGHSVPSYSASIAAAWEVVEKVKIGSRVGKDPSYETRDTFHIRFNDPGWCAGWVYPGADYLGAEHWTHADTAPLVICLAALKTLTPGEPSQPNKVE